MKLDVENLMNKLIYFMKYIEFSNKNIFHKLKKIIKNLKNKKNKNVNIYETEMEKILWNLIHYYLRYLKNIFTISFKW